MKISMDWIEDFVELPKDISDRELSEQITLGVCEVDDFERKRANLNQVIVAEIIGLEPHPNADKLTLATVNLGHDKTAAVVCGAPNCRSGIKVPYAPTGTVMSGGHILEQKKIRGIISQGMLCAEDELGLSDNHEGLMELDNDSPPGSALSGVLDDGDYNDLVLDVDNKSLTHRPDCWGYYGLAREFAVVLEQPFNDRFTEEWAKGLKESISTDGGKVPVTLHVDPKSSNRGFLGLSMDRIKVDDSPKWMQRRLIAAGMRPINTVVDISNYVMLETGIPNHIFDRREIRGGKIIVRRAGKEMAFLTLDEQKRIIIDSDTMVCDGERELSIAGVMGGLESSIADDTTEIMIEVANWTDAEIRHTSTRLGLRTDASQRYEKSLDSHQLETCLLRLYELFKELYPGSIALGGIQSDNMPEQRKLVLESSPERISAVLGRTVSEERFTLILEALGFSVKKIPGSKAGADGKGLTHRIHVPTWRSTKDIECEADIVEEIGRIIGYETISPVSPRHSIEALRLSPAKIMFRRAQDFLVLKGQALEVMTYPLLGESLLDRADWPLRNENLVLKNALNPEQDRMRPSLIPSLLLSVSNNRKEHENFRIFEYGRSYRELSGSEFSEDLHQIGIAFHSSRENPFMDLADVVEELIPYLGLKGRLISADFTADHPLLPKSWPGSHPHELLDVQILGKSRGIVLSIHPHTAQKFKIKGRTAMALLDLTELMNLKLKNVINFQSLDRYPGSNFDLTVVLPEKSYCADAVAVVNKMKLREIRSVGVLDVFKLDENRKALTLRITFRDSEKTLDADFLKKAEDTIIRQLGKAEFHLRSS